MDPMSRRLLRELKEYRTGQTDSQVADLAPTSDDDLQRWKAVILGQEGTPYEGGKFDLEITVPRTYPMQPPTIRFLGKVCHPNVHFKTGEICLDLLKTTWSPAWTLHSACIAIGALLMSPEADSPLNCDAANLLRCGDVRGYNSLVRMYTQLYGVPSGASGTATQSVH
ncbi:ubiquitin-conjugating enzyme/RWD-like protein [Fimicolochytrium jonesii]|uniref:ubiquitin-conjugating enzyme/RWD-like protein n=1 Tax=Fimicolochytrium jonesii TaxID=1396493 RepID=UPI0022FF18A3|nr:ubiquitin-conjugating enzyme/RWD-like protein [Fimicolochytrium jonesii]KAI8822439.1 ubiquitin-conjugating enzyme/RWD-like protein [Fimicolochytrium jonesii]